MEDLKQLTQIDWWQVFIAVVVLLVCIKFLWMLADWFFIEKLGLKTRKMRQREQESEKLNKTYELAKTTAENLYKLQERHTKDEEEFRTNLNNYMEESRKDRKALHDEMKQHSTNRVNDRQVSIEREKKLNDRITETNKQTTEIIGNVNESLSKLTDMIIDNNIENMRWEILNLCSALTSGRKYNKESFDHLIKVHGKYEKILEENSMENGQVTASMEVIMDVYKEKLKNGF